MKKKLKRKVNIYDVAEKSGYSTATVSLVLKNDPRVKQSTKEHIRACIKKLNYNPNYLASSLASRRTNNIGLVIPNLRNPVFAEMVEGIESFLQDNDYHVLIGVTNQDYEKELYYLDFLKTMKIDGLILFPTFLEEIQDDLIKLQESGFPLVICGLKSPGLEGVSSVSSNASEGAYLATEHLIKKGHQKICFLSGEVNEKQSAERLKGYQKAFSVYGLTVEEEFILRCSPDLDEVYQRAYDFLGKHPETTAFFCLYDYIAYAAMKAIHDRDLKIPDHIAVIGYDDIELNKYQSVPLSSVHTNSFNVGETAARIVLNQLQNPDMKPQQILLAPQLIIRSSC